MAKAKVPGEVVYDPYKLLLYKKAIRKGKERENTLRINIIGNYAQGKTSLANRLMGKTCEGVTTTNGIEINRYKCQTFDDGSHTFTSFENENQDFLNRVATVARSIKQTIRSNTDETNLEENLKYDYSEQSTRKKETPQDKNQTLETKSHVHVETVASKLDEVENFVQPVSLQIPEIDEKKTMSLSPEEMATFSNVIEVQKDEPAKLIDIWDFGGQYIFYATHTLFHSRRALYLLVFDLTKSLDTTVLDEEFPGETGDRNMEYFARFWLESIHAYTGPDPQVILVGTHKDKLHGNDLLWKEYFENVRCLFDDTELIHHIQREDFAVDNYDMSDPVIAELLEFILKKHQELVQHVEIPARWIHLEKSLRAMETPIISFQELIELDKRNEYPLHDEEQLKLFLHYHHEKGSLFFYDEDQLSDSICLDPKFLVDAFKCIITSEHFFKNDPDIRRLRTTLSKEGRLSHQLIDLVWSNKPDFLKHKDVILGFLKKQNIIAEVVEYNAHSEIKKQKDWFIVPSLLKDHSSKEEVMNFLARKSQSQVRYAMKFDTSSIVHQVFHKALAAALGIWPVVKCGTKQLLFENFGVFKLTRNHTGLVEQRKDSGTIELRVVHLQPKQVEAQVADEFRRFVESIVQHEFRRLKYQKEEKDKPFVPAYRCNHTDHGIHGSSQLTDFKQDEDVISPDNVTHESFDDDRAKKEWLTEYMVEEVYPKMHLTEKTLSKLAQVAIGANWSLLGPQLQIDQAEIDHIEEQHKRIEMQIYSMLLKWKYRSAGKATLDVLVKAIKKCPRVGIYWDEITNIRDKYLRKQEKQEIDFSRPLSNKTVTVNETLTLECEVNKPDVSVTWLIDGEPITQGDHKTMSSNGGLHKLIVEDVKVEDADKYTCVYGNFNTQCFVKIEDTDDPLKFLKELSDIEVGDLPCTVTFSCELNTSQTEVEWYYRNQRLYASNKYAIIDDGSTHMLKIADVSENDEGKYSVLAKDVRSEATLYVEETEEERYLLAEHRKRQRETEEERYLLAEHRKRQRAHDDSEHLKSHTQMRLDSGVNSAQKSLNNSHVWSVDSEQTYTIKVEGDKEDCFTSGYCMLPTGDILLTDFNNTRLKKFDDRYQLISVCNLPGSPRDICYCRNNEAVLTMEDDTLQFVDVTGGMSLTRKVKADHECWGLTCHGNQLYVVDKKSVYIYSTDGIKQRVLYTHHSGDPCFLGIALSDDGNYIYITDVYTGLHTFNSEWNHLYTFTDAELDGAWDISVDGENHVLMSEMGSNKVLQVSSDGKQKLGIIVDNIRNKIDIRTIYFNRGNATLTVAGESNKILVLKLK